MLTESAPVGAPLNFIIMGKFNVKNFDKPTPRLWKRIGNTAIYGLPLLVTAVQKAPWSMETRADIAWYITLLCVLIKIISKFFTYDKKE